MTLPLNNLLHGDCAEVLSIPPKNPVDLVFVDQLYNLQLQLTIT